MKTIETYLPIFSGFYNTIWQPDEEQEISWINEQREEKGFEPITYDDCNWDNTDYEQRIAEGCAKYIHAILQKEGLIKKGIYQSLYSPREYNFRNDSINVEIVLTKANEKKILSILKENSEAFAKYLKDTYTSYSGFISFHSNTIEEFMTEDGNPLEHKHKLGSILEFILKEVFEVDEYRMYEDVTGNTSGIQASNYEALIKGIEPKLERVAEWFKSLDISEQMDITERYEREEGLLCDLTKGLTEESEEWLRDYYANEITQYLESHEA